MLLQKSWRTASSHTRSDSTWTFHSPCDASSLESSVKMPKDAERRLKDLLVEGLLCRHGSLKSFSSITEVSPSKAKKPQSRSRPVAVLAVLEPEGALVSSHLCIFS